MNALITKRPFVKRRYCEISERHGWLIKSAALIAERLIIARHPAALQTPTLSVLHKLPPAQQYRDWDFREIRSDIPSVVPAWRELNHTLFWYEVGQARRHRQKKERVTDVWHVSLFPSYWRFDTTDFDQVVDDIRSRPLRDDRLVALSLAFRLYTQSQRPRRWLQAIKAAVAGVPTLRAALHADLHPPARTAEQKSWKRQEARWKRRDKKRAALERQRAQEWKDFLPKNIDKIREPGLPAPSDVSNHQYYLHEKMRELDQLSTQWSKGDWQVLEAEFGSEVAEAFRDGVTGYWRRYRPKLRSEGKAHNSTPFKVIFGLTGLNIEAREIENWASTLSEDEAEIAFRYAMDEMNGFPDWMPSLFEAFPDLITRLCLVEVDYELRTQKASKDTHYALEDLSRGGPGSVRTGLGAGIFARLEAAEPKNLTNLGYMLTIIHDGGISPAALARLAERRSADRRLSHAARWFAVWTGVEPNAAIPALTARLDTISGRAGQTRFAMQFITQLLGGRLSTAKNGDAYRTPEHLKTLYALMHRYIRQNEDIERAGKGTYSPGLRDDAQDARNQLFALLKEIPGKEAYLALRELAQLHPEASSRPWMQHHATSKAELDADLTPWTVDQTLEFQTTMERTPSTHRELFELAEMRFLDLKDNLEHGDSSIADILRKGATEETDMRKYIGDWLRERAYRRYAIPQEEQLADDKRMDLRFHGMGFDAPLPVELKLADKWTGPKLFERLENQLCGDYLRDIRSDRGLFVLVYRGEKQLWELPDTRVAVDFAGLASALHAKWLTISEKYLNVDDIRVVAIDLTRRSAKTAGL